jgi:hypothetical protein
MQIDVSDEQERNTPDSSRESFDGASKMASRRESQWEKQFEHRISTEFGMRIEASSEQWANPDEAMRRTHEPAWKQTSPIDRHLEKQKADKTRIRLPAHGNLKRPKRRSD